MSSVERTICLGEEHDQPLRQALLAVHREMGGLVDERMLGVGGSQEVETVEVVLGGNPVRIEAETYVGVSITGEETLVEEIAKRVGARLAHP